MFWHYPRGYPDELDDQGIAGYLQWMGRGPTHLPSSAIPELSGRAAIWLDDEQTWQRRQTVNTPYGWYTFDIVTRETRLVDTSFASWDYFNLWLRGGREGVNGGVADNYSLGVGGSPFGGWLFVEGSLAERDAEGRRLGTNQDRWNEFIAANPWPAFDPWVELLLPGQKQTRPGLYTARQYDGWALWAQPFTGYMRLTCGEQ